MSDRDSPDALLTRRAFVKWVGKGALVVGAGGFIRFLGRDDNFIRPPGARPEEDFLYLCVRCDKCREACPWGLITLVPVTESVVNAGTPRLRWICPRCMRCGRVCPTGALR